MTKISKILLLLLIIITSCILSSCGNKSTTMEHGVTLTVSSELKNYMLYPDKLPSLHFDYDGVKVLMDGDGAACFFVGNDQYELSDKFAAHIARYNADEIFIIDETEQTYDKGEAKFGADKLKLDETDELGNAQPYSKEYQIVCVDSDGTRYSYQYRTFVSNSKRYYIYRYTSNMGISLEQSLMVVKTANGNKLVLTPLPYNTKYEVSGASIKVNSLIKKDKYLDERYTKFAYPSLLDKYSNEVKNQMIKDWYIKYCNGQEVGDEFTLTYLGAKFSLSFGVTDAGVDKNLEGFKLVYLGDA